MTLTIVLDKASWLVTPSAIFADIQVAYTRVSVTCMDTISKKGAPSKP